MSRPNEKVWCAWCGDDIEPESGKFCDARCEREFWHDVYEQEERNVTFVDEENEL